MMNITLRKQSAVGNPHIAPTLRYGGTGRLGEGEVASEKPRRWSLLYKRTLLAASLLAVGMVYAARIVIPAPGGVGNVVALTNALTSLSKVYGEFALEPGVYDLSTVAMNADSHLSLPAGHLLIGLGAKPGDTILLGGGSACNHRVLQVNCYNDYYTVVTNLTVTGGWVDGTRNGGGVSGGKTAIFRDCIFSNNVCGGSWQYGGGAIFCGRAEHCYFENNRCLGGKMTPTAGSEGCHGGAMWCNDECGIYDVGGWQGAYDCVFTNCHTKANGGGVRGGTCMRSKFYKCSANYGGGAADARLIACDFIGNTSNDGNGGGAFTTLCVTNCTFRRNYTKYEHAGGLTTKGNVPVIGCTFEENSCNREGGGLCCNGGLISNCVFKCNVSRSSDGGGGLAAPDADSTKLSSTFKVVDCIFEGNRSSTYGGGVNAPGGFFGCTFRTNLCSNGGGGVYCRMASSCGGFTGCTFVGNKVTEWAHGGGVLSDSDAYRTSLTNCVLDGNVVNGRASAAARISLDHCTVTNHQSNTFVLLNCNLNGCLVVDNKGMTSGGVSCDTWLSDFGGSGCYTNVNCVFENNYSQLASIVAGKTCINCLFVENEVGSNYGSMLNESSVVYNSVLVDNKAGGYKDINKVIPYLTNCTYVVAGVDPQTSKKCAGCFKATRAQLRLSRDPATPYAPRASSPLRGRGFEASWLLSALGDRDFYGQVRVKDGKLDIGAASCQDPTGGFMFFVQ